MKTIINFLKNKQFISYLFIIYVVAFSIFLGNHIYAQHEIITKGKTFIFRALPVDPYDYFRGRYITIKIKTPLINLNKGPDDEKTAFHYRNKRCYAKIAINKDGVANFTEISKNLPEKNSEEWVKIYARYSGYGEKKGYEISLIDNRFYLNEKVAPAVDDLYATTLRKDNKACTIEVKAFKNQLRIKEVYINKIPITKYVRGLKK